MRFSRFLILAVAGIGLVLIAGLTVRNQAANASLRRNHLEPMFRSTQSYDGYLPEWPLRHSEESLTLVHTWFKGNKQEGFAALDLVFSSFLVTQNLDRTRLIVWMSEPWDVYPKESIFHQTVDIYRHHPNIEFRVPDTKQLAQGTCFAEREEFLSAATIEKYGLRDYANVIRWLLLFHYGGIWVDTDTTFLLDLHYLAIKYPESIFAGLNPVFNTEGELNPNEGHFNNNFLMVTNHTVMERVMSNVCLFRRLPTDDGFRNVIPTLEDGSEMKVLNNWIYNDGALRSCLLDPECPLVWIGLGETDPIWLRTNDMLSVCERLIQSGKGYFHSFQNLIRIERLWQNKGHPEVAQHKYLDLYDVNKHVWVIHNRAEHCRTYTVAGSLEWWDFKVKEVVEMFPTIHDIPNYPITWNSFDRMEFRIPNFRLKFIKFVVFYFVDYENFGLRQAIRAEADGGNHQKYLYASVSTQIKPFFVVPLPGGDDNEANIFLENWRNNDIIMVDKDFAGGASDFLKNGHMRICSGVLPAPFVRATAKFLNNFDSHYFTYVFDPMTTVVNHGMIQEIAGEAHGHWELVWSKDKKISPVFASKHRQTIEDWTQKPLEEHVMAIFSRDRLPLMIGDCLDTLEFKVAMKPSVQWRVDNTRSWSLETDISNQTKSFEELHFPILDFESFMKQKAKKGNETEMVVSAVTGVEDINQRFRVSGLLNEQARAMRWPDNRRPKL